MSCGSGKETYSSNVQCLEGELIDPATFKIAFQVVIRDQKILLDRVRFVPVELDVDLGICAGSRDVPRLQGDVVAEVWTPRAGAGRKECKTGLSGRRVVCSQGLALTLSK